MEIMLKRRKTDERTAVRVPNWMWTAMKDIAVADGRSEDAVVREAIRKYIKAECRRRGGAIPHAGETETGEEEIPF